MNAWYLRADNTIEQSIWELLNKKRKVVDAAADGSVDDDSILGDLVAHLQKGA